MPEYYYSTQPFLTWVFNTYFFKDKHFAWVGMPFYPYKRINPRTSSPLRIYEDIYEMWLDRDPYDCLLPKNRLGIRKSIDINIRPQNTGFADLLDFICDNIDIAFFCPIVYRIDLYPAIHDPLREKLLDKTQGSAAIGSQEYRILDLNLVGTFDILFMDFENEDSLLKNHTNFPRISYQDHMIRLRDRKVNSINAYSTLWGYC